MSENLKNDIRCARCKKEFVFSELRKQKIRECPNCGTRVNPYKISHDRLVKLNWEEIRILAIYAQRWIGLFDPHKNAGNREMYYVLCSIIDELNIYKPKDGADLNPLVINNDKVEEKNDKCIKSPYFIK